MKYNNTVIVISARRRGLWSTTTENYKLYNYILYNNNNTCDLPHGNNNTNRVQNG